LQTSLAGQAGHSGPALQASYTFSKSLDDVSGLAGGAGSTGAVAIFSPQDPFDTRSEKGPSSFDVTHAFTLSAAQSLHFEHLGLQSDRTKLLTKGWDFLSISTITSGSPFTVYSGIRKRVRERLAPARRTRPEHRTFQAPAVPRDHATTILGGARKTEGSFRFPSGSRAGLDRTPGALEHSAVIPFEARHIMTSILRSSRQLRLATRKAVWSRADLQFRAELFNLLNIVNMGLPANIIAGTGFGMISKAAGTSPQIQFSLKLIY
jgi:hypothetical protein